MVPMLLAFGFVGGIAGSLHCVAMCGAFPLALRHGAVTGNVKRQLLYNVGRLNTLLFVGAVSGGAGAALVASAPMRSIERALAIVAGGLMVLIGCEMLGLVRGIAAPLAAVMQRTLVRWLSGVMSGRSAVAPLALGVFNAFLPCHLIYAFAARAAATASALDGAALMLSFGLGTVPAMLLMGTTPLPASLWRRRRFALASGLLVAGFGVLTLLRGVLPGAVHVH
jgi:sulfite exporter TauE/SafE